MKKRIVTVFVALLTAMTLTACGEDPELSKFQSRMDDFCDKIVEIDHSINEIDPNSETAVDSLMKNLDELDQVFRGFGELDFPEKFDYLESIADEASSYMTDAVKSYHDAYSNGSYNEYTAEYAEDLYARAYKRVNIIISFLHGETPEDVNVEID